MKYKPFVLAMLITLIGMPRLTLAAWPLTLHDDGGPYRAIAVDSRGSLVVAAIATPTAVELTAADEGGTRIGSATVELPPELWQQPRRLLWVKLYRTHVDVTVVLGDDVLTEGRRFRVPTRRRRGSVTFGAPAESQLAVPDGARNLALWQGGGVAIAVWVTQDGDNIATVQMARLP